MSKGGSYFFNSLPNLYEVLKKAGREKEAVDLIKNFLNSSFSEDLPEKVNRFLETGIGFIPADMDYFRLYYELVQLYTNGLFYSTIVLAGVLCERICYDILSKQKIMIEEYKPLSEEQIECLFEMNLFDLISLLRSWNLIKEETKSEMIEINNKRNQYVHPKKGGLNSQKDSLEMIKRVRKILENEFEIKVEPKGIVRI